MSDIYLSITETPAVVTLSQPVISGALSSTVTVANTVTVALDANSLSALENVTVTVGSAITGTVTVANLPSVTTVAGTVAVSNFPASSSVTIANFPSVTTVTGTVALDSASLIALENVTVTVGSSVALAAGSAQIGSVSISNLPSTQTIAGTVTANNSVLSNVLDYDGNNYFLKIGGRTAGGRTDYPINVSGTVTIGSLPAISGTVTANNPNGALTTRFGSVTTANLSQLTSCVTNTSRKYLLAQNISAGTVTIGIGFSPTTTQGIQLTAGGGLTFDAFCPTGAVYWLGAVTGAAFTILEG